MVASIFALAACGPETEQSPLTLEEMTQGAVRDFHTDAAEGYVDALVAWLHDNVDDAPEGWYFEALDPAVVEGIEHSDDIVWEECLGAGVVTLLYGTLDGYAAAQTEPDQSFADGSYTRWDRTIVEGDADGFLAGADMRTDNDVEKSTLGYTIPYGMTKDFRWFGDTFVALTVVPEAGYDEAGDNGVVGGFTVEVWYEEERGVVWYNGQWSDLKTLIDETLSENPDFARDLLIDGTRDYMFGTEEHVTGQRGEVEE